MVDAKKNHECFRKIFCYDCKKVYDSTEINHNCKLKKVNLQNHHTNLGFITCEWIEIQSKLTVKKNICDIKPILIDCLLESKRGAFHRRVFTDSEIKRNDNFVGHFEQNVLEFDYYTFDVLRPFYEKMSTAQKYHSNGQPYSEKQKSVTLKRAEYITSNGIYAKLLHFLISPTFQAYSFLTESDDVMQCIMAQLLKMEIIPVHYISENKYYLIHIPEFNLSFLNIKHYLPFEINELINMYSLNMKYPIFPFTGLNRFGLEMQATTFVPTLEDYISLWDTAEIVRDKERAFLEKDKTQKFDLATDLLRYSRNKITIIARSTLILLKSLFKMQEDLMHFFDKTFDPSKKSLPFFSPFTAPNCTLAGFNYNVFKYFGLSAELYAITNEYGEYAYNCSPHELDFILYYTNMYGESQCYSAFSPNGVKRFKNYSIPDIATDSMAGWMMGCALHGHMSCKSFPNATPESTNMYGEVYSNLNARFDETLDRIKLDFPEITTFVVMWECEWKSLKESNDDIRHFMSSLAMNRPQNRICIRDTVRGGISECYAHYFDPKISDKDVLRVEDAVSCYPTEMFRQQFPVGKGQKIIGECLESLYYENGQFVFQGKPCWGAVQIRYEVPKDTKFPFLQYKYTSYSRKRSKIILSNCYKCGQNESPRQNRCSHSPEKRSFVQTLTLADVSYMMELGYTIHCCYEALLYFECDYIFREYLKFTSRQKICSSSKPRQMSKAEYCQRVNSEMDYKGELKISPEMLQPNKGIYYIYKTIENSMFGKFSQAINKTESEIINSQEKLELCYAKKNLINYHVLTGKFAQVLYPAKPCKVNLKTNCLISGYILSYSKISMHKKILQIAAKGKVFHYSTDQIIYSLPKTVAPIFENIEIYGYLRNVHEDATIECFLAMGPFYYAYVVKYNTSDQVECIVKYRGINTKAVSAKSFFSFDAVRKQFKDSLENVLSATSRIPNYKRKRKSLYLECLQKEFTLVTLNNEIRARRTVLRKSKNVDSLPFGYNCNSDI